MSAALDTSDAIAATAGPGKTEITLHRLVEVDPGCCSRSQLFPRKYVKQTITVESESDVDTRLAAIKAQLDAEVTSNRQRAGSPSDGPKALRIIYNPHSGGNTAGQLFNHTVRPLLELAGVPFDVAETTHAGHPIEMGATHDPHSYEGVVFISGDGTVKEFLDGITSREDWLSILARTPMCSVARGTANALARGAGTLCPISATFHLIKHHLKPVDALLAVPEDKSGLLLSVCGTGWGVPGDISAESEAHRCLGRSRYCFLKMKRGCCCPIPHDGGALWSTKRHPFVDTLLTEAASPVVVDMEDGQDVVDGDGDGDGEEKKTPEEGSGSGEEKEDAVVEDTTEEAASASASGEEKTGVDDGDDDATPKTPSAAMKDFLDMVDRRVTTGEAKDDRLVHSTSCQRCYSIEAVATHRRLQYASHPPPTSPTTSTPRPLDAKTALEGLEDLPTDPRSPPASWQAVTGRFVAVGAINTAEDSVFSHPSDGTIDMVSARKGSCVEMCGLLGRYVCGDEFKSPLMHHEKVQTVVIAPADKAKPQNYNVDGEVMAKTGTTVIVLLPGIVALYGQ